MKVLVAIDGQPFADAITNYICNHNWPAGTRFLLVHVMQSFRRANDWTEYQFHDGEYKARKKLLEGCANRIKSASPESEFTCSLLSGDAADELLMACKRVKPDLLVIGSHGRGLLTRKLLGSVSYALANHVDCSTMIVRLPQAVIEEWSEKQVKIGDEKLVKSI